jgi:hypothetical protein
VELDGNGYVADIRLNLIEGVRCEDFEPDLLQGDGNELKEKFRAAHSSSALAVNVFAPFKSRRSWLRLPGGEAFELLNFERKCPHGLAGRRPPNLDLVADGPHGVVAVESKCLEPLSPHIASFAPAYNAEIIDGRRQTAWFKEMCRLAEAPHAYRWLDAAQLIKHAFGILHTFPNRSTTLLYLFWEPSNPNACPAFAEHRNEIRRFADTVGGGAPEFIAMSYPELWEWWESSQPPAWLKEHIARLRARYLIAV